MQKAESQDNRLVDFPVLPTETEIYILPDGEIVVADLPMELAAIVAQLRPCSAEIYEENHWKAVEYAPRKEDQCL